MVFNCILFLIQFFAHGFIFLTTFIISAILFSANIFKQLKLGLVRFRYFIKACFSLGAAMIPSLILLLVYLIKIPAEIKPDQLTNQEMLRYVFDMRPIWTFVGKYNLGVIIFMCYSTLAFLLFSKGIEIFIKNNLKINLQTLDVNKVVFFYLP
ncbi:MAG: hypothetical protein IPP29_05075 [Bacteroidetes bacterium]|nr:hypothetical protein [Bacteroidota bacterium]